MEGVLTFFIHITSGKSGPKDQVALHYTILRLRIGERLTRYRNCKFQNFARTISRHADGISRYFVPTSAGPLLGLPLHITFLLFKNIFSVFKKTLSKSAYRDLKFC